MAEPIGLKKVHRYTVEFNIEAVRLSLHPEIQTQDVGGISSPAGCSATSKLVKHGMLGVRFARQLANGGLGAIGNTP